MPYVSIQELGEAVREADKEAGMSEQQLCVVRRGGSLSWGLSGRLCTQMLEKQCHSSLTGFLPVARAGHLHWCLDEGSISVICKHMGAGDMP